MSPMIVVWLLMLLSGFAQGRMLRYPYKSSTEIRQNYGEDGTTPIPYTVERKGSSRLSTEYSWLAHATVGWAVRGNAQKRLEGQWPRSVSLEPSLLPRERGCRKGKAEAKGSIEGNLAGEEDNGTRPCSATKDEERSSTDAKVTIAVKRIRKVIVNVSDS